MRTLDDMEEDDSSEEEDATTAIRLQEGDISKRKQLRIGFKKELWKWREGG